MELSNSIASLAMDMSAAKFQQNLQTAVLKKSIDSSTDMMMGLIKMIDSVPKFSGENGSILNVRA